jgi:hypothetical protein
VGQVGQMGQRSSSSQFSSVQSSQFTVPSSEFRVHEFRVHSSRVHSSEFRLPRTVYCLLFTVHCSLFTLLPLPLHCSLFYLLFTLFNCLLPTAASYFFPIHSFTHTPIHPLTHSPNHHSGTLIKPFQVSENPERFPGAKTCAGNLIFPFIHTLIPSYPFTPFTQSLIHSPFTHSPILAHLLNPFRYLKTLKGSCAGNLIFSFIHTLIPSFFTHSPNHSPIHRIPPLTQSLHHSLTPPLTHLPAYYLLPLPTSSPFTHSPIHSFTHSLNHSFTQSPFWHTY